MGCEGAGVSVRVHACGEGGAGAGGGRMQLNLVKKLNPAFWVYSFLTKRGMFCLSYSASWSENLSKIPPSLFLKCL